MALVDDRINRRSTAEGMIDIPVTLKAATHAGRLIVALDRCATDMAEAAATHPCAFSLSGSSGQRNRPAT